MLTENCVYAYLSGLSNGLCAWIMEYNKYSSEGKTVSIKSTVWINSLKGQNTIFTVYRQSLLHIHPSIHQAIRGPDRVAAGLADQPACFSFLQLFTVPPEIVPGRICNSYIRFFLLNVPENPSQGGQPGEIFKRFPNHLSWFLSIRRRNRKTQEFMLLFGRWEKVVQHINRCM